MEKAAVAEVLERAADLYESEQIDWCQGAPYRISWGKKLSACAMGALYLASGHNIQLENGSVAVNDNGVLYASGHSAARALGAFLDDDRWTVAGWNDAGRRTKQEVIDAMKECAKELRNGTG